MYFKLFFFNDIILTGRDKEDLERQDEREALCRKVLWAGMPPSPLSWLLWSTDDALPPKDQYSRSRFLKEKEADGFLLFLSTANFYLTCHSVVLFPFHITRYKHFCLFSLEFFPSMSRYIEDQVWFSNRHEWTKKSNRMELDSLTSVLSPFILSLSWDLTEQLYKAFFLLWCIADWKVSYQWLI